MSLDAPTEPGRRAHPAPVPGPVAPSLWGDAVAATRAWWPGLTGHVVRGVLPAAGTMVAVATGVAPWIRLVALGVGVAAFAWTRPARVRGRSALGSEVAFVSACVVVVSAGAGSILLGGAGVATGVVVLGTAAVVAPPILGRRAAPGERLGERVRIAAALTATSPGRTLHLLALAVVCLVVTVATMGVLGLLLIGWWGVAAERTTAGAIDRLRVRLAEDAP